MLHCEEDVVGVADQFEVDLRVDSKKVIYHHCPKERREDASLRASLIDRDPKSRISQLKHGGSVG